MDDRCARRNGRTGTRRFKIKYNKVFGFSSKCRRPLPPRLPADYIRKQTLVGAERYITPALKEKEEIYPPCAGAQSRNSKRISSNICARKPTPTRARSSACRRARAARLPRRSGRVAIAGNYVRPDVDDGDTIEITTAHPVVEALQGDRPFVPNDVALANSRDQILLITGPNMAGKSTFIRQVAHLTLMGRWGVFVRLQRARRRGGPHLHARRRYGFARARPEHVPGRDERDGEYPEQRDRPQLVILDEIGPRHLDVRGLEHCVVVVEYLPATPGRRQDALRAHYHELTELERRLRACATSTWPCWRAGGRDHVLIQIVPVRPTTPNGIYAGKVAGLPRDVIERAQANPPPTRIRPLAPGQGAPARPQGTRARRRTTWCSSASSTA